MIKEYCQEGISGCRKLIAALDEITLQNIADKIDSSHNVFVYGPECSGFALMGLVSRLRQMKIRSYLVEESPPAPSVREGDLVIIASPDGETRTAVTFINTALRIPGIEYVLITMNSRSSLIKNAVETLVMDYDNLMELRFDLEKYMEWCEFITFDAIALYLMRKRGIRREKMLAESANL
jgi:D-arabinose 5-phosphate isomerase GutQ